ncbi:hypothetical protein KP509_33G067700 [Ceratopteris richardii]|uniref:Uncharacterized protein n=1 Tax=Ceratopteris richardii TaxID=49495 RepID=A0A8T2QSJ7_CERRI|nr:hypothetical protein KP509_33G067700 [Ceratopteris richardii]
MVIMRRQNQNLALQGLGVNIEVQRDRH